MAATLWPRKSPSQDVTSAEEVRLPVAPPTSCGDSSPGGAAWEDVGVRIHTPGGARADEQQQAQNHLLANAKERALILRLYLASAERCLAIGWRLRQAAEKAGSLMSVLD